MPTITGEGRTVDAVDAVVTCGEGGYAVSAVNKSRGDVMTLDLEMLGGGAKEMRIHTVNGPSVDSYNDIGRTEVGITDGEWEPYTGSVKLAPHSVNVIEIR